MKHITSIITMALIGAFYLTTALAANGYQSSNSQIPPNNGYHSSGNQYDHAYPTNHRDFALSLHIPANLMTADDTYFFCDHCKDPRWVKSHVRLSVPTGAVVGGGEPGRLFFVCRAAFNKGIHPGKLEDGRCHIPFEGRDLALNGYEVLVSKGPLGWVNAGYGEVPSGAIVGGRQLQQTFYICQAELNGGVHPGKLFGQGCHISWGGKEIELPYYNVLVR